MKRCLSFVGLILAGCLFFTGCSTKSSNNSKTLECTATNTVGSTLTEEIDKIYFVDDKVDKVSLNISVTLSDSDTVTRDNLENDVNSGFAAYKNRDGVSYSSNVKDDGFVVKMDINYNKLSEEDKAYINIINPEKTYDEIKVELESNGFSCK